MVRCTRELLLCTLSFQHQSGYDALSDIKGYTYLLCHTYHQNPNPVTSWVYFGHPCFFMVKIELFGVVGYHA